MLTLRLLLNGYNDLPSWFCIICIVHLNLQTYLKYNQVFPRTPSSCPWYRWSVYSPTNCIQRYSPLPVVYRSQQAVSHWLLGRNWSYRVVQYTCLKMKLSPSSPCSDYLSTDSHFATCVPSFMWYLSLLPIRGRSQIFEDDVFISAALLTNGTRGKQSRRGILSVLDTGYHSVSRTEGEPLDTVHKYFSSLLHWKYWVCFQVSFYRQLCASPCILGYYLFLYSLVHHLNIKWYSKD